MTSAVNSATSSTTTPSAATASGIGGLTMSDFLTLMTTQLKNQDPLNPTDSNQFLSQLSELSTVEGISSMNTSMSSLSSSLLSSQAVASASLVGHGILAQASSLNYTAGTSLSGAVQVPANASSVTLTIADSSGAVVRHITVPTSAGEQSFSWDGTTDAGTAAPSGTYSVAATANVSGTSKVADTYLSGTVSSISLDSSGGGVTLNTPELGSVALSSVQQIG